jgi:hypothetical protein
MNREELFDRHLRGELTAEEAAEFKRRLANEPETGRAFVAHVNETTLLVRVGSQLQSASSSSNVVPLFPADGRGPRVPEFSAETKSGARGTRSSRVARWAALAACVMALAAVVIALGRKPVTAVPPRSITEVYVTGERVQVMRAEALLKGHAIGLQAGDIISTATNHRAAIAYEHESTRIEIQPGSVVVFGDATNGKRFELRRGIIRARVAAQPAGQPLRVKTTLARATVLGTEFVMRVDEGATKLDVLEGKVEFACRMSGKKVKVKSGFSATLSADAPPSIVPLCSSNCILRECRGTNTVSHLGNFETQK